MPAAAPSWIASTTFDPWSDGEGGLAVATRELVDAHGLRALSVIVDADAIPLELAGCDVRHGSRLFAALVREKSAAEVGLIAANLAGNDAAFARIARELRIGDSDLDVLSWAMDEISRHAGAPVAYDGNLGLGSAGGDFEAQPQGVRAAAGDVLFVDLYPMRHGYAGDSTRSFVMGHPPAWAVAAHARLVRALEAAEAALLPGTAAGEVDRVCREAAAADGGEAIPHHVGHGLGIFGQEPPYLVPGNPDLLRSRRRRRGGAWRVSPRRGRAASGGRLRGHRGWRAAADGRATRAPGVRMSRGSPAAAVTGAASGIGRSIALLLAERGYVIVAADIDVGGAEQTAEACGRGSVALGLDVTAPRAGDRLAGLARESYGRLDALVTAAGISIAAPLADASDDVFDRVVDTSLRGTFRCCRDALPLLRADGGGAIVTVGSIIGRATLTGVGAYAAAKAGIEALTRSLAIEEARAGVRANCLLPGSTDTPLMWDGLKEDELPGGARPRRVRGPDRARRRSAGDRAGGRLPGLRRGVVRHRREHRRGRGHAGKTHVHLLTRSPMSPDSSARLDRYAAALQRHGASAIVLTSEPGVQHACGVRLFTQRLIPQRPVACVVTAAGDVHVVCCVLEVDQLAEEHPELPLHGFAEFGEDPWAIVAGLVGPGRVHVEETMPAPWERGLASQLGEGAVLASDAISCELRAAKDAAEHALFAEACAVGERAIAAGAAAVHPGATEYDVAEVIESGLRDGLGSRLSEFSAMVIAPQHNRSMHHLASDTRFPEQWARPHRDAGPRRWLLAAADQDAAARPRRRLRGRLRALRRGLRADDERTAPRSARGGALRPLPRPRGGRRF